MKILFVHPGKALLPEIAAYRRYFGRRGIETAESTEPVKAADGTLIEWHFMGAQWRRNGKTPILIHEYASLSQGLFRRLKDRLKRIFNCRPDFRIYLNEEARATMAFGDGIPWGYRRICFFESEESETVTKKFDFVYAGSLEASRQPDKWLDYFRDGGLLEGRSVLIISDQYAALQKKYSGIRQMVFEGPFSPFETNTRIREARYGLNLQPDIAPFNTQASMKFLAYAAAGIPIISTDYEWVRKFQQQFGGRYHFLHPHWSNFNWRAIEQAIYESPDLSSWGFEYQLKQSGILTFLADRTGDLRFIAEAIQ